MAERRTFLGAAAETVNAANAFKPLTRHGYPAIGVFAFGWPTSENVPLVLAGSAVGALWHAVRGDYRGAGSLLNAPSVFSV